MLFLVFSTETKGQDIIRDELYNLNGLSIHSELIHCESITDGTSKEYVILTIENQNDHAIELTFKKEIWYNGTCLSCDSESLEYAFTAQLEANGALKGSCTVNNGLRIFAKMTELKNVRQLTHFELKQISVREIN